jgi:hypothetical protein
VIMDEVTEEAGSFTGATDMLPLSVYSCFLLGTFTF